jgi:recombination protein U
MIGYPTKKKPVNKPQTVSAGKRGQVLEADLNQTNQVYLDRDRAVIHKKPTPITLVNVDYPARSKAKITEAYFKTPSTTDYNGVYRGKAIDFEAKETANSTSFSLSNVHPHQIEHLRQVVNHGAIAFLILRFTSKQETYLIPAERLLAFIQTSTRKSLPYAWVTENGHLIPYNYLIPVNYLNILDDLYFQGALHD